MSSTIFGDDSNGESEPLDGSPEPDEPGEFGLVLDLDECLDEFSKRAKVLPFVRPEKFSRARF